MHQLLLVAASLVASQASAPDAAPVTPLGSGESAARQSQSPAPVRSMDEDDFVEMPGELVVGFRTDEAPEDLGAVVAGWGLDRLAPGLRVTGTRELLQWTRRRSERLTTVVVVEFEPAGLDTRALRAALSARPEVEFAAPNRGYLGDPREILTPNDPQYGSQYHHPLMQNDLAWNTTLGDPSVIIGVTDDGVDTDHVDLIENVWINAGEIPNDGIDNDGNGYVDDVNGWDFVAGNADPNPNVSSNDHGTHCAGIAAARTDNGVGVAGTAGRATIMPLQFYSTNAPWTATDIAESFAYGVDNGARILTTSYNVNGWVGDPVVTAAYDYLHDNGVLHFNSAGNGSDLNPPRQAFTQSLLVISTTSSDQKSGFSNYGDGCDICAPGSSVLSTELNNTYGTKSGTSMAAPNAAGAAALIWSAHPTWTRDQVAAQLIGTGDDIDAQNPGLEGLLGGGRVNTFRALNETLTPPKIVLADGLPAAGSTLLGGQPSFTLRFDRILDTVAANDPMAMRIEYAGADGLFGTADDEVVPTVRTEYLVSTNLIEFTTPAPFTSAGEYRFIVDPAILTDPFGAPIDGNGDGVGGDPFERRFSSCGRTVFETDPAESGAGWSVENINLTAGAWTVPPQVPNGGGARNDPPADFDGSGRCFLTQNGPGNTDVDGGPTRLTSRAFDVSGIADPYVGFALWVDATGSDDYVSVDISDDDGATWTPVATYFSAGEWRALEVRVLDHVAATSAVRLRFSAEDAGNPSILEAGVDALSVFEPNCGGPGTVGTGVCFSVPNSTGVGATIRAEGSDIVADNDFTLIASNAPAGEFGLFFAGDALGGAPLGNGFLCIDGTLTRFSPVLQTTSAGDASLAVDLTSPAGVLTATAGATTYYQFWFRDGAAGAAQNNLSSGLQVDWN